MVPWGALRLRAPSFSFPILHKMFSANTADDNILGDEPICFIDIASNILEHFRGRDIRPNLLHVHMVVREIRIGSTYRWDFSK